MQSASGFVYGVRMSKRRLRSRSGPRVPGTPRASTSRRAATPGTVSRPARRVERLAYTRSQAAEALGISRSTFIRRVLPYVETFEMPWGARLIPVDELERLLAERRRPGSSRPAPALRGRPRQVPEHVVERVEAAHAAGRSLGEIARELNADGVPTAQGGRQRWPSTVRAVLNRVGGESHSCRSASRQLGSTTIRAFESAKVQ